MYSMCKNFLEKDQKVNFEGIWAKKNSLERKLELLCTQQFFENLTCHWNILNFSNEVITNCREWIQMLVEKRKYQCGSKATWKNYNEHRQIQIVGKSFQSTYIQVASSLSHS